MAIRMYRVVAGHTLRRGINGWVLSPEEGNRFIFSKVTRGWNISQHVSGCRSKMLGSARTLEAAVCVAAFFKETTTK